MSCREWLEVGASAPLMGIHPEYISFMGINISLHPSCLPRLGLAGITCCAFISYLGWQGKNGSQRALERHVGSVFVRLDYERSVFLPASIGMHPGVHVWGLSYEAVNLLPAFAAHYKRKRNARAGKGLKSRWVNSRPDSKSPPPVQHTAVEQVGTIRQTLTPPCCQTMPGILDVPPEQLRSLRW